MIKPMLPACNAPGYNLADMTYEGAEYWYRQGLCSEAEWQRFQCYWRNTSFRFSNVAQAHEGHDPATCPHAK